MYARFEKDPSSVDESWHDFFKANPGAASSPGANSDGATRAPSDRKTASSAATRSAGGGGQRRRDQSGELTVEDITPESSSKDAAAKPDAGSSPARKARGEGVLSPVPTTESRKRSESRTTARPTQPEFTPPEEQEEKTLRGPAAAIARNMDASLQLPTATSVR